MNSSGTSGTAHEQLSNSRNSSGTAGTAQDMTGQGRAGQDMTGQDQYREREREYDMTRYGMA